KNGEHWAVRMPDHFVHAARLKEVDSFGQHLLRICDITSRSLDEPARAAVSATVVTTARAKYEIGPDDERAEARRRLKAAIVWFPGEPGPGDDVNGGENINQNNNLAYMALEYMDFGDDKRYYGLALERSRPLAIAELGGVVPPRVAHAV